MNGRKIIEGAEDALAVAKGEKPAARIYINGHAYAPAGDVEEWKQAAKTEASERRHAHREIERLKDEVSHLRKALNAVLHTDLYEEAHKAAWAGLEGEEIDPWPPCSPSWGNTNGT